MRKIILIMLVFLLSACGSGPTYNGYIDADLVYLSSNFPGRLENLLVTRGQAVHKNQLLFELEQAPENYHVGISQFSNKSLLAQREQILSQIHYAEINNWRTSQIRGQEAASQNDVDMAARDLAVLRNQLAALDAQIKGGELDTADKSWQLMRKQSDATEPGIIFDTYYTQGEYVQAGQPVLSLVTQGNIKVIFFVAEDELSRVTLNQKIKISSDGDAKLGTGYISYISNVAQFTPPMIFSREDRHDLVFRVEAKVNVPDLRRVHLGQPVSLELVR